MKIFRSILLGMLSLLMFTLSPGGRLLVPQKANAVGLPLGVDRWGNVETAWVDFQGKPLLQVASTTVFDRQNPGDLIPVEQRAAQVEANLTRSIRPSSEEARGACDQIANPPVPLPTNQKSFPLKSCRKYSTTFDPETLTIAQSTLNSETVLLAQDAYRDRPQQLLTITELDAQFHGLSIEDLADRWQDKLQTALKQELKANQPEATRTQLVKAIGIFLVVLLIQVLLWQAYQVLRSQAKALQVRQGHDQYALSSETADLAEDPNENPSGRISFGAQLRRQLFQEVQEWRVIRSYFTLRRQRKVNSALRWAVVWAGITTWFVGLGRIFALFPVTSKLSNQFSGRPFAILMIIFAMSVADRITDLLIERSLRVWVENEIFSPDDWNRKAIRADTLTAALKGMTTGFYALVSIMWILETVGVAINSLLTGGAVVGGAIAIIFQDFIRDFFTGCLILWEDQYAIGDVVAVGQTSGLVENMNLRVTQLRDAEGRLITIPNRLVKQAENLTRGWSRVNFDIDVAYDTDIKKALTLIQSVAKDFYADPAWSDYILEEPQVLGLEKMTHEGLTIRVWIKTQPLKQWEVARAFRFRIRLALADHNIDIGKPQQLLSTATPPIHLDPAITNPDP